MIEGEWARDPRAVIDLAAVEVPDNEYTRAYAAQCDALFSDPDLRLATDPDWRPSKTQD